CTVAMTSGTLYSPAHWVHSDAPAIGFAALACLALYLAREAPRLSTGALVASGLAASLSVWSKQTMAPLGVVLPLWVLLTRGWRDVARAVFVFAACLVAVSLAFRVAFGHGPLVFNILTVPGRHPWNFRDDVALGFAYLGIELVYECLP